MTRSLAPNQSVIPGRVVRGGHWSVRIPVRTIVVCSGITAAIVALAAISLSVGEFPIPLAEVWATLAGNGTAESDFIVNTLRLPRLITAILAGACFGISGATFQSLARNPLGSPDIVGFDAGASLGAVTVLIGIGGGVHMAAAGAAIGGLVTAILVYALAWRRGVPAYRLILVGLGIGFVLTACVDYFMTRGEIVDVQRAAVWLTGSLNGRSWDHAIIVAIALAVLLPPVLGLNRRLRLLELGDDTAAGLGIPVERSKLYLGIVAVLLAALAVAAVGPVAFLAFMCGPIARRMVGTPHAAVIPAAFVGALFMVAADLAARQAFPPTEFPVGIATAVVGAPYLLWLLSRQIRTGTL